MSPASNQATYLRPHSIWLLHQIEEAILTHSILAAICHFPNKLTFKTSETVTARQHLGKSWKITQEEEQAIHRQGLVFISEPVQRPGREKTTHSHTTTGWTTKVEAYRFIQELRSYPKGNC